MKLDDWMGSLPPKLTRIPICQLKIPGSHDSGADSSLNCHLPVANDETSKMIHTLGMLGWIRRGVRRQSIRDQLSSGIRYFDFRVSHPPKELRDLAGEYNLVHALYGPTFEESLLDLRQFLVEYPSETVLLDVNHVFGMGHLAHVRLKQIIGDYLGWERLCPQMDPQDCTLDFMRARGYQVLVFMCADDNGPFWSQDMIISPWPETNKIKELIAILDNQLAEERPKFMDRFFVSQGVLTATMKDVMAFFSRKTTMCSVQRGSNILELNTRSL